MLLDDTHFEGVNKFKELVKEEVIKDKVQAEIKENFNNIYQDLDTYYKSNKIIKEEKKEEIIDDAAKEIEKDVKKEELAPEKVEPPLYTKYLNRLYFAIITGCLLGYGDIYPVSNISKILAGIQGLLTVSLIIY
tara:strand:+ start:1043 stop:1444 length:402 start_codon:yes stop_codon:yes gene_type:complete